MNEIIFTSSEVKQLIQTNKKDYAEEHNGWIFNTCANIKNNWKLTDILERYNINDNSQISQNKKLNKQIINYFYNFITRRFVLRLGSLQVLIN